LAQKTGPMVVRNRLQKGEELFHRRKGKNPTMKRKGRMPSITSPGGGTKKAKKKRRQKITPWREMCISGDRRSICVTKKTNKKTVDKRSWKDSERLEEKGKRE